MSTNLIEPQYDRINPEIVRWSKLEYAKRIALDQNTRLLADFATVEDRDVKELLSHVISIGGQYLKEIYRQQNSEEVESSEHYIDILKIHLDAIWWVDGLTFIYQHPGEREKTMLDLLRAAASFFKETVELYV